MNTDDYYRVEIAAGIVAWVRIDPGEYTVTIEINNGLYFKYFGGLYTQSPISLHIVTRERAQQDN
ncbi:hypothetical protein [Scytonema sp. NUACC26]|uniref:hypothetical protein n=1 Tax=Scytonema sp. NUACC26 TaxID=3140176 RepID=UPI0034DCB926